MIVHYSFTDGFHFSFFHPTCVPFSLSHSQGPLFCGLFFKLIPVLTIFYCYICFIQLFLYFLLYGGRVLYFQNWSKSCFCLTSWIHSNHMSHKLAFFFGFWFLNLSKSLPLLFSFIFYKFLYLILFFIHPLFF